MNTVRIRDLNLKKDDLQKLRNFLASKGKQYQTDDAFLEESNFKTENSLAYAFVDKYYDLGSRYKLAENLEKATAYDVIKSGHSNLASYILRNDYVKVRSNEKDIWLKFNM